MNSSFYEAVTKSSQTKFNNAVLNSVGQAYLQNPAVNPALPLVSTALQPMNTSYENNLNVRLFRSTSVKENRLNSLVKNYLTNNYVRYDIAQENNTTRIRWNKAINLPFRYITLYNEQKEKRVHSDWINLPDEKIKYIIKGLL